MNTLKPPTKDQIQQSIDDLKQAVNFLESAKFFYAEDSQKEADTYVAAAQGNIESTSAQMTEWGTLHTS